jgi:hypothetical protein
MLSYEVGAELSGTNLINSSRQRLNDNFCAQNIVLQ